MDSIDDFMRRFTDGDSQAARDVFERFAAQLVQAAKQRLGWKFQRQLDPEDVVQSAFMSFFRMQADGESLDFENWNSLWGLLHLITMRKCGHRIEHFRAACRDVTREKPDLLNAGNAEQSRASWEAVAGDPTPSQAVILAETVQQLLGPLNELDRQIVTLALQGWSVMEISEKVGRIERKVQRVLKRMKDQLLVDCAAESP